ncbi:MAG: DNA polymerase III subunit delta [Bacteroidales bacterium]|nr:DNA polymerase III subunit delta [Bacteroidales bacterium]
MQFREILADLKNRIYHPVYLLHGEEPWYIDQISGYIEEHVLTAEEKEFNQVVIYGRDTDIPSIIAQARQYPMMSSHQVVVIKEAQDIEDIGELASYVHNPLPSTILVINYKYSKADNKLVKLVQKKGVDFQSPRIYENKIPAWIADYSAEQGYRITLRACAMITEFLGNDLGKIVNELGKLFLNYPKNTEINDMMVEQHIGISKDFNIFELQKAIGQRNTLSAFRIAAYFASNPRENPLIKTVAILNGFFCKLLILHQLKDQSQGNVASALSISPFFVREYMAASRHYSFDRSSRIISLLREYDLKSKGMDNNSTADGELLKELLFRIFN